MDPERDSESFARLLEAVAEGYDKTISPARIALFFGALKKYDFEIVRAAVDRYISSSAAKYGFPQPIHIIEIIEGSEEEREIHAWNSLTTAIRRVGNYQSLIVEDWPFAQAVLMVFGSWHDACLFWGESTEVLWAQKRRDFIAAYRVAKKSLVPGEHRDPVLLPGLTDRENGRSGHFPDRQPYGILRLNGEIVSRTLDVDARTGLPAAKLPDVIALPPPKFVPQLPAAAAQPETGEFEITDPAEAQKAIADAFSKIVASKGMSAAKPVPTTIREMTPEEEAARRQELERQKAAILSGEEDIRAAAPIRRSKKRRKGSSHRASDHGRASAKAGT